VQNTKEALECFPDDYEKSLFPLIIPEEVMEVAKKWNNQYIELMQFRNNSKYGRSLCFNCLLCPDKEKDGNYVGINRLVARAIEGNNDREEGEDNNSKFDTPTTTQSVYPCSVLNRFKCPYERQVMKKQLKHQQQSGKEEGEEDSNSLVVKQLFGLAAASSRLESAFIKARKEKSIGPIENVEDIYNALTDRETLDKLLQQELEEVHLKYKDEIVDFFMSIKDNIRMEDLTFYKRTGDV
jgi:hypothetical protein